MSEQNPEDRLSELEAKWLNGTITDLEAEEYARWYNSQPNSPIYINEDHALSKENHRLRLLSGIQSKMHDNKSQVRIINQTWVRYAAAILLILGTGFYIYIANFSKEKKLLAANNKLSENLIQPVYNNAILTLSDGRKIVLNNSTSETISDGHTIINKSNGILNYYSALTSENAPVSSNTMSTPRGGQYQLVLPDGSKVWLNSASSLKYPTVFSGKNRTVELAGEAYFDIKENKAIPFTVKTNKVEVAVLGTAFNINSYEDEPVVATTLINGSVKVIGSKKSVILKPNQQACLSYENEKLQVLTPNMEEVLAWKNGIFQFEDIDIRVVMRQIARWYDVDIIYEKEMPKLQFSGSLLRTESPTSLLKALEKTDRIYFITEGRKITVHTGIKPNH